MIRNKEKENDNTINQLVNLQQHTMSTPQQAYNLTDATLIQLPLFQNIACAEQVPSSSHNQ